MLISLDWIQDFVDLSGITPDEIYSKFTLAAAEVEGYSLLNEHLEKISVVKVLSKKKHPEADKLNLVTFQFSDSETREVVCGAPNVREGMKTAYAPIGATLPGGFTLEPKKIRGVLSNGMLCSQVELGLGEDSDGIMDLPEDAELGQTLLEFLKE